MSGDTKKGYGDFAHRPARTAKTGAYASRPIVPAGDETPDSPQAAGALADPGFVLEAVNDSVLFIGLTTAEKQALVAFAEPMEAEAGECIVREGAPGDALYLLASGTVEPMEAEAGECIVREGAPGDALYLLASGTVDIVTAEGTPNEKIVTSLSGGSSLQAGYAGAFFGEMALIDIEPRSATVRAQTDIRLIKLAAPRLRDYYQENRDAHLTMITNIARSLSRRLRLITDLV